MNTHILVIDNYDSFTFNLVQYARETGAEVTVLRNDAIEAKQAADMDISHLLISPGPGRPKDAGISLELIGLLAGRVPVLGVCLGHQAMIEFYGGRIEHAPRQMHGKSSAIHHDGHGLFAGLPMPFEAGRYHSLSAPRESIPDVLEVCAWTEDGEVMGVRHREHDMTGVQFHPESILTPDGKALIRRFVEKAGAA